MKLHNTGKTLLDYYFESLNQITNRRGLLTGGKKKPAAKNEDTVYISPQAQSAKKNAAIEAQLRSGEPMKGVSYKEFCNYWYDTHGQTMKSTREMQQLYRQALKGDNASLREKEWRTNPEYIIPSRLYSSPEIKADREAALEKYRNGGELTDWESKIMHTFPNGKEGCNRVNEAKLYRETTAFENKISKAISDADINLSENDELHFEVWGHELKVAGNLPDNTLKKINDILADKAHSLQYAYDLHDGIISKKGGFPLMYLQEAENYLKGTGVSVFDISKDRNGNFVGLPDDMNNFIKKYAVGEFGITDEKLTAEEVKTVKKAQLMRETFNSAIDTVQKGKYDMYKAMSRHITFKNGKFEF